MARSGEGSGESPTPSTSGGPEGSPGHHNPPDHNRVGAAEGNEDVSFGFMPRAVFGRREQPDLCHQTALPGGGR